jgi:hypothetical protein
VAEKPSIPYAVQVEVVTDPPRRVLHVKTLLQHLPSTPGFDAERHYEMMKAIGQVVGPRLEYDACVIHAPDHP